MPENEGVPMQRREYKLETDPEFKLLVQPLDSANREILENNIKKSGCSRNIAVWHNIILQDYELYEICHKYGKPFNIVTANSTSREEMLIWVCKQQLARRDLSEEMMRYLIGKRCNIECDLAAHEMKKRKMERKFGEPFSAADVQIKDSTTQIRERLGDEYHISYGTVRKYSCYAASIETVNKISSKFVSEVLTGRLKMSQEHFIDLTKLPKGELSNIIEYLMTGVGSPMCYAKARELLMQGTEALKNAAMPQSASIKDMPAYDPDAEISSLAFTVPSWASSINRVRSSVTMGRTSLKARDKLQGELLALRQAIDHMVAAIKEVQ